jgi:hypothetical protein
MKILFSSIFLLSVLCLAQQNNFNKEYELQKFVERGGRVNKISPDVYEFIYPDENARVFDFNKSKNQNADNVMIDTTIINVWEIDTTKYNEKFSFWQRVDIYNLGNFTPSFVDDLNGNGLPEIYGRHNLSGPVEIYERNASSIFTSIYSYPDLETFAVEAMGEIHGIGEKEIYLKRNNFTDGVIYRSDSIGVLPTTFDFTFYYGNLFSISDVNFGDWDKNGITDCVFISADTLGVPLIIIGEFGDSINNFTTVYEKITADTNWVNVPTGFAIGDFDNDGKTELIAGATQGIIYSIEVVNENLYELVWQGNFSTLNAYMNTSTNDIDGNGKTEFWIGGQDFEQGITKFQCYEAGSDNDYKTVAVIELRYINTIYTNYVQAKDVDGDSREELIISITNVILILKFTGTANDHQYEIYYAKIGEATQPGAKLEPVTLADLDGDKKIDILLPFLGSGPAPIFSYILRNDIITVIQPSNTNSAFSEDYIKTCPVPFNLESSISFAISKESFVKIKIYNSLGKEIKTLLDEKLSPGEYNIQWEAKDNYGTPLPSGVYFISLQTDYIIKTTKTILLK